MTAKKTASIAAPAHDHAAARVNRVRAAKTGTGAAVARGRQPVARSGRGAPPSAAEMRVTADAIIAATEAQAGIAAPARTGGKPLRVNVPKSKQRALIREFRKWNEDIR